MSRFKRFALFLLIYNVGVILWGAYVRATGSGAGCGNHWPLCNGQIIPVPERIQTWIELSHRASSGLCLVFVVGLMAWSWKLFPKNHPARRAANWSFGLTISEALVGAALVLFKLVEKDQSVYRAVSISIHLINTLFLLAALTLTVRFAYGLPAPEARVAPSKKRNAGSAIILTILLAMTGALTALGDTLFQSTTLLQGMAEDFSAKSPFLLRLRIIHPVLAVVTAIALFFYSEWSTRNSESGELTRWARVLQILLLAQMALGACNLLLLAPISLQIIHLFLADALWISLVMLSCAVVSLSEPARS